MRRGATTAGSAPSTTRVPSSYEACHESSTGAHGADAGSAVFGPLGAGPSVVVHLPRTHQAPTTSTTYPQDTYPDVEWARIPGGTVIAAAPSATSDSATSIVTAVDDDGTVRWTRCLPGLAGVSSGQAAELVLVPVEPGPGTAGHGQGSRIVVLAAEDGSERDRIDANRVVAASSGWAVVARDGRDAVDADDLRLVDLRSGTQTRLDPIAGTSELSVDDHGVVHGPDGTIWHDGRWVADPDPAPEVTFDFELGRLTAHRGANWSLPLAPPGYEGTELVQDDHTVVAWVCESRAADDRCALAAVGVDLASGRELWRRSGDVLLGAGGDGYVLLQHGLFQGRWALHDMRTGAPVPGQTWTDETAFQQGCCEEGRWRNVGRVGGTLVVQHDTEVRIWFSKAHSHATVDVRP